MAISTSVLSTRIRAMLLLCTCFMLSGYALAATYWVSPTGTAAWANCVGSTPLFGTAACSLSTANSKAAAGDVVYLRGGTYLAGNFVGGIQPANNGTSGNMITFAAYTGETPTITQSGTTSYGICLGCSSASAYIKISGITFHNLHYFGNIVNGSNHIELAGNTFSNDIGFVPSYGLTVSGGSNQNWVTHIWIHGNTFATTNSNTNGCTDGGGDLIDVGDPYGSYPSNTNSLNNYITIENNVLYHSAHATIDDYGMYQVIRNNVFHNEPWSPGCPKGSQIWPANNLLCTGVGTPWDFCNGNPGTAYPYTNRSYDGLYAHRNFQISEDYNRTALYDLIEGNRSGYAGANQANDGPDDFDLAAPRNIVRYNFFYGAMQSGLMFKYNYSSGLGAGGHGGTYNKVYNNTFYNNGIGYLPYYNGGHACSQGECPDAIANVTLQGTASGEGNVLLNNLMYLGGSDTYYGLDTTNRAGMPPNSIYSAVSSMASNFCTSSQLGCSALGNPLFTNPDISDPTSTTLPDLTLQSSSPAIDGGTYLTQASGSGTNSTALVVGDASYFQDGTWGADLARGVCFFPDWIAIGTVTNTVQISSVNYAKNTITLASPKTWSNGASIWLYKKSDGTVVLNGAAPDYGASEYTVTAQPQCLQALVH